MELAGNKDLLQTVFDSASNGIAVMQSVYNENGRVEDFSILLFNAYTLNWIGDTDYKGKRYGDVFPMVKETGILEKFIEVAETGVAANFERWYTGEGMKHWFRFRAVKQGELLVVTTEDITDQRQAEEMIRQNEERFRFALKAGHLGSWELNLKTFHLEASDHCKKNFGQPVDQPFLYETLVGSIHPDDRQRQEEEVAATISTGKDYDIEYRVIWPDGTIHWVHVRGQLHSTKDGKPDYMIGISVDITERKRTELALTEALESTEKQQRLYDSITDNTPDLVYVFDLDYRFTYANKALLAMWGKSAEDAIGKGLRDNGYEEWHAQMHEREIDEIVATKKSIRGTVSFPHAELGSRVYDYILVPVLNAEGNVEVVAGTTRDVTDLKHTEEKLQQSESRLKTMIDQTPAPTLVLMGDDLVIEQVNASMLKMLGRGEEVIGVPLIALMPELEGQYIWEQVQKVYNEGISFDQAEVFVPHNRGGVIQNYYYNIAYRPLKKDGQIVGMIQVAIDVTEQVAARKKLEESENRFRALVNASSDVVYSMNGDWSVMNPLDGRGFISDNDTPITNWMEKNLHRADHGMVKKAIAEAIANKSVFELEHRVLTVDGTTGWTFSRAVPILDDQGNIIEWFGSASDITIQKNMTEKLESLVGDRTKELQRSNEDLQQFAHVASHDLKEPVRKIKTFTIRLEEHLKDKLDETATRFIERIHVATDRMATMIDGVLSYSTTNAVTQKAELVDLNEVIKNIETDLEVSLQQTGGVIHYHDLPKLEGAPVLLYQLFYNLINNSIKFARAGIPPQIILSSETYGESKKGFVRITVKDNGIGFEPSQAERIFETFSRLNSKDKYEGTGLGLSLCKKIAERHGGSIVADSDQDKGATFIITFPLQQTETGI